MDAVGQNYLRVSGSTAIRSAGTSAPSLHGQRRHRRRGRRAWRGEATVYLLPPAPELAPIAVDDTVVVRAGVADRHPRARERRRPLRLAIHPRPGIRDAGASPPRSPSPRRRAALPRADRAGRVPHRLLGLHDGLPALADTATVHITVSPTTSNRAPRPETLEGRVLSGSRRSIPFDGFGMDPDGDVVEPRPHHDAARQRLGDDLRRWRGHPLHQRAGLPRPGVVPLPRRRRRRRRPVEGTVRIGVLGGESNPWPVTFTDYV